MLVLPQVYKKDTAKIIFQIYIFTNPIAIFRLTTIIILKKQ